MENRLAREAAAIGPRAPALEGSRRDHDLVAPGEILQGATEDLFRAAVRIMVGGIEEVDAELECLLDERTTLFLIERPRMVTAVGCAVGHAAEDDGGNFEAGAAEFHIAHGDGGSSGLEEGGPRGSRSIPVTWLAQRRAP